MSIPENPPPLDRAAMLRVIQIIALALLMGVLTFSVITVLIRASKGPLLAPPAAMARSIVTLVALGFGGLALIGSFVVPNLISPQTRKGNNPFGEIRGGSDSLSDNPAKGSPLLAFQTRMILTYAILEGAAFFNGVAFLLEGQLASLVLILILLAVMIVRFPTENALDSFIENQRG